MNTLPNITAIIPSKDRFAQVQSLVANLRRQQYPQEKLDILIIDDGSNPAYRFNGQSVQTLRHGTSRGAQVSRNEGLAGAQGELVLMLDDDIELLGTNFIRQAVQILTDKPEVAAVFGRQLVAKYDHGIITRDWEQRITRPSRLSGELVMYDAVTGPIDWGNQVFLARKKPLMEIGGYDGIYGLNGGHSFREESDLHARLRRMNYQLWFDPELAFRHHVVNTGGHGTAVGLRLYWIAHNHIIFLRRHLPFWPLRAVGFLFDVGRYSWVQGRFRYLFNMLHGYLIGWRDALRDRGPGRNLWLEKS
jgi:glycosyltransferase involved in cell wall biosynthesis